MSGSQQPSVVTVRGLAAAVPRASRVAIVVVVLALSLYAAQLWLGWSYRSSVIGFDFQGTLWEPANAILDGRSPYPAPIVSEVEVGNPALYPPTLMFLVIPLTVLPYEVAVYLWVGLLAFAVGGALAVLGVRDVRCYALTMLSAPVVAGLIWGNVTLLLVPLVALAWRYRQRWVLVGTFVGIAIAAKLFLWPLCAWLLGTRRYRATAMALGCAAAATFIPWAVMGFDGLAQYPDLLRTAEKVYAVHSYSIATLLSAIGVGTMVAVRLTLLVGVVIALVAFGAGRKRMDDVSISLAVVAAVLGSPIVWEFYYALLLVPVAILWPRLSWAWIVLFLFYFSHALPRPRLLSTELEPGGSACCKPDGVPMASWAFNHAPAGLWPALANALLVAGAGVLTIAVARRRFRRDELAPPTRPRLLRLDPRPQRR